MKQPSPFLELLNSNDPPSDQHMAELRLLLRDERAILHDLDQQMQILVERQATHEKVIREHSALLSAVRRLPHDVLLSIFEYTCLKGLTPAHGLYWEHMPKGSPPQVILSHVCQEWRRLSLGHPTLWSEVCIVPPPHPSLDHGAHPAAHEEFEDDVASHEARINRLVTRIQLYISRSDRSPLTVTLSVIETSDDSLKDTQIREDIVNILCSVSRRLKRLSMNILILEADSPLLRLFNLTALDVPLLEDIEISVMLSLYPPPPKAIPGADILRAQRLQSLKLFNFPKFLSYPTDINWRAVTELHMDAYCSSGEGWARFAPRHAVDLLSCFPHLINCSIAILPHYDSTGKSDLPIASPISLPHLKSLTIREGLPYGLASSLQLPSLDTLCVSSIDEPEGFASSELVNWARTFGSQLKELTFHYRNLSEPGLLYILENIPNVTSLRMIGNKYFFSGKTQTEEGEPLAVVSDLVLEKLTGGFGRAPAENVDQYLPLCPNLRRISLWPRGIEFTEKALMRFIASRRRRNRIQTFEADFGGRVTVPILETVVLFFEYFEPRSLWKGLQDNDTVDLEGFQLVVKSGETFGHRLPWIGDFVAADGGGSTRYC